mgnify:CR=1 FL=1
MAEESGGPQRLAQKVGEIIQREFQNNISVKDLAKRIGVTPNYLSAVYRRETGETIMDTVLERKMELAKRLLQEAKLKIGQIATATGFSSPYYFSRRFHQYQGVSPTAYRERVQDAGACQPRRRRSSAKK